MRRKATAFEPGELVPENGLYVCDCGGQHLHWGADERRNRTSVTDPSGATTEFAYDVAGRLTSVTDRGSRPG